MHSCESIHVLAYIAMSGVAGNASAIKSVLSSHLSLASWREDSVLLEADVCLVSLLSIEFCVKKEADIVRSERIS